MKNNKFALEVRDINTHIEQYHILQGVDFEVLDGAITVLLGRNGAGKTTTLKSILGLTPPQTGEIVFQGEQIQRYHSYEIASKGIGYVPENRAIFRDLSVLENLKIAERIKGDLARHEETIFELFPDLKRFLNLKGNQLSGGQQQMLAIARSLVANNHLLLIDEPSEGLAPVIIDKLMATIRQLAEKKTVLLVEQNFIVASKLADRYVILEGGMSVKSGRMVDLVEDKAAIQRYLQVA